MRISLIVRHGSLLIALGALACATSPTGRKQLMLVGEEEMKELGDQAFLQLQKEQPVDQDPRVNAYVQCVTGAIADVLGAEYAQDWNVRVFADETVNAFALPGGNVGVYTGMLDVAETPAQLAAVIGHEIGHVMARHSGERVSQAMLTQGGLVAADIALGSATYRAPVLAALGIGAQVGVLLPFSRKQESEADHIGQILMARAGFNPQGAVELWQNMARAGGAQPPEFLSTHPSHETRIEDLQARMPEALQAYRTASAHGRDPGCRRFIATR